MRIAGIVFCGLLLAACSQSAVSVNPATARPQIGRDRVVSAPVYGYLYGFKGHPGGDGKWPNGRLVAVNGTMYGVTMSAGTYEHGIVFSIDAAGDERVVYAFKGYPDGALPNGLTFLNGSLYGTTSGGGGRRGGTVFALTPSGSERILHSFGRVQQGGQQPTGLVPMGGRLYGVTELGGAYDRGSIYEISTSGNERLVYSFKDGSDGAIPDGQLFAKDHLLYGTTMQGGGTGCYNVGCGTFFSVTPAGTKTTLYDFKGMPDGAYPEGVIFSNGVFYGVSGGGADNGGALYAVNASGSERIVHSFGGSGDGYDPTGIIGVGSTLYGTTGFVPSGFVGTLFELDASGTFSVIHKFADSKHDGGVPNGAFAVANGILFGTTAHGGLNNYGSVFTLSNP